MSIAPETTIEERDITIIGNTGQIAIGEKIVQQINHTCVINQITQEEKPKWERGDKLEIRPRKPKNFLNRTSEIKQIESEIQANNPIILNGTAGIGKSALIEYLAHLIQVDQFQDGMYYLSAFDMEFEDLLQNLFSAFFESNVSAFPNRAQIKNHLQKIKALILIDDISLSKDEIKVILNIAPHCVFIFVSSNLKAQNRVDNLSLKGLPESEAQPLFEQAIGRSLDPREKEISREICRLLNGHPENILRLAAKVQEEEISLAEIISALKTSTPENLIQESMQKLPLVEQKILFVLAAADGRVLPQAHIYALLQSDEDEVKQALDHLIERNLIQSNSPAYSLTTSMTELVTTSFDISLSEDALISHFVEWVVEQSLDRITDDMLDTLMTVTRKASRRRNWSATIKIGRVIQSLLFVQGKWKAWEDVLNLVLKAAKGLGDKKVEAWTLHQLGSRLLCLDFKYQAQKLLKQAAKIRKDIGDVAGLEVTQHNLSLLPKVILPKIHLNPPGNLTNIFSLWIGFGLIAALGLATLMGIIFYKPESPTLIQPLNDYLETNTRSPQFEWQPVFLGDTYQLQVDDQENFSSPEFDIVGPTTNRTRDTLFDQGTYYWRVRGINRFDRAGEWSETWQFILSIPPSPPSLSLPEDGEIITGNTRPDLSWGSVENGIDYHVQVDNNNNFNSPEFDSTTDQTATKVTTSLGEGLYYWRARAINTYDTRGEWSETWEMTINLPPATPVLKSPENNDLVETRNPVLEWDGVQNVNTYQIQVDNNKSFSSPRFDSENPTTSSRVTASLDQGVYYWRVRAIDFFDEPGQWSDIWKMTISIPPNAPILISPENNEILKTTDWVSNQIGSALIETSITPTLEWAEVQNGDTYQVQVDNIFDFSSPEFESTTKQTSSSIETGLPLDYYYWRVRAINSYGTPGEWSTRSQFIVSPPPATPSLLNPSDGAIIVNDLNSTFSWNNVTNAKKYQLQIANNSSFNSKVVDDDSITTTSKKINISLAQGVYSWRVRAINEYDTVGDWSSRSQFTISIAPGRPQLLYPNPGFKWFWNSSELEFSWKDVSNAEYYQIQIANDWNFTSLVIDENNLSSNYKEFIRTDIEPATACKDFSDDPDHNYIWRVRAINPYGTPGQWSSSSLFIYQLPVCLI